MDLPGDENGGEGGNCSDGATPCWSEPCSECLRFKGGGERDVLARLRGFCGMLTDGKFTSLDELGGIFGGGGERVALVVGAGWLATGGLDCLKDGTCS